MNRRRLACSLAVGLLACSGTTPLAEDTRHHRKVAVKVLLPDLAAACVVHNIFHQVAAS